MGGELLLTALLLILFVPDAVFNNFTSEGFTVDAESFRCSGFIVIAVF